MDADYFDWINKELIPFFKKKTEECMKKGFAYDFLLAADAAKHAEAMAVQDLVYHAPSCMLGDAKEENAAKRSISNNDFYGALELVAADICSDAEHREILERNSTIGIGIAFDRNNHNVYVVQRMK